MPNFWRTILKIQWFPLSILIFCQTSCFLGPTLKFHNRTDINVSITSCFISTFLGRIDFGRDKVLVFFIQYVDVFETLISKPLNFWRQALWRRLWMIWSLNAPLGHCWFTLLISAKRMGLHAEYEEYLKGGDHSFSRAILLF